MNLPVTLPDWLPWWVPLLLLVPATLWALAFLLLPFGVIGLKGRLETIEARLDEIQGEIRSLTHRLPEPMRQSSYDDVYAPPGMTPRRDEPPMVSHRPRMSWRRMSTVRPALPRGGRKHADGLSPGWIGLDDNPGSESSRSATSSQRRISISMLRDL